ncbi:unnamed protein product [Brassica napus]|uniref:(rape) hypothetical protein n=1 Tax=Brassica napus TaxID=3708 RepID=A0A816RBE6_BRANA|nr:unnamed protein product [Brassica napus]
MEWKPPFCWINFSELQIPGARGRVSVILLFVNLMTMSSEGHGTTTADKSELCMERGRDNEQHRTRQCWLRWKTLSHRIITFIMTNGIKVFFLFVFFSQSRGDVGV